MVKGAYYRGLRTNGDQGGGNSKQGSSSRIGVKSSLASIINRKAGTGRRFIDPCPTKEVSGNQTVSNQQQANALRGVTKIIGSLIITGNVTDWSPFDCLKEITGNFNSIDNNVLTKIEGFGKLRKITGNFDVIDNNNLTNIEGFGNLENVSGYFDIFDNALLTMITSFNKLVNVGGYFSIDENASITSIHGFSNLKKTGDFFSITNSTNLTTITGFGLLQDILGNVDIVNNGELTEIVGFGSLTNVLGNFAIFDNTSLETITGFNSLANIVGFFNIGNNTVLTNAEFKIAFNALKAIGSDIVVIDNLGIDAWELPDGWSEEPQLKWGATIAERALLGNNFTAGEAAILNGFPSFSGL